MFSRKKAQERPTGERTLLLMHPPFVPSKKNLPERGLLLSPMRRTNETTGEKVGETRAASRQTMNPWCDTHSQGSPAMGERVVSRG